MLDRYYFGDVTKLSQEAPVPVVMMKREEQRPGAAANVAMNCQAMGANTRLLSIVGDDIYGETLATQLKLGCVDSLLRVDSSMNTTQKLRVIGKQQQIVRIDFESRPSAKIESLPEFTDYDIIVFSDYGKGALSNIQDLIKQAKALDKIILVDPKGYSFEKYRGADLIKPNLDELRELVGGWGSEEELSVKAHKLMVDGDFKSILLTRASDGMTLFTPGGTTHVKTEAIEVYDVCGAGDVAISAFAVALTRGNCFVDAMRYANKASGISVGRFGTVVIKEEEVFS